MAICTAHYARNMS